ncbi:MAG TPA: hypothetical protein VFS67_21805 [Polyangiaceae bacterium]|nr:hypothetical protein [Polyangiaceae bacterium]
MAQDALRRTYARAEFSSTPADQSVNLPLVRAQILQAAGYSIAPVNVSASADGGIEVVWLSLPLASDETIVDGIVAAHNGSPTTSQLQQFQSLADTTNATTTYAAKQDGGVDVEWVTAPLKAGAYLLRFSAQVRMSATAANTGVQALLRAGLGSSLSGADDRAYTEASFASSTIDQLYVVSDVITVTEGQRLRLQPRLRRLGASGSALMRNAYLDVLQVPAG